MKSMRSCVQRPGFLNILVIVAVLALSVLVLGVSSCDAQWGYFGRGTTAARSAFSYRGPILSIQVGHAYTSPWLGGYNPTLGTSRYSSAFGASPYDRYRGIQPTQAELDRERFYQNLDRTHRYTTREDRYANDFYNAYASPSAMVNRYRDPYVAGTPAMPWTPLPIPGLSQTRHDSRYQGYVPDDEVAIALRAASIRLTHSLTRKADGHIWIRHLQPGRIIDAIDRGQDPAVLVDLLINYHGVAENPRLVLIAAAEGFKDARRLLEQYVTLPSPYPTAQGSTMDTIIEERVIGDQVIGDQVIGENVINGNDATLNSPSLNAPLERLENTEKERQPQPMSDNPRLDSLPDDADVELLPAPVPTPIDS